MNARSRDEIEPVAEGRCPLGAVDDADRADAATAYLRRRLIQARGTVPLAVPLGLLLHFNFGTA